MITPDRAQKMAEAVYEDRRDRLGYQELDHPRRVAEAQVSESAKAVAWLHDTVEDDLLSFRQMYTEMSAEQFEALLLLTRERGLKMSYREYIEAIANAPRQAGEIAREVKKADLRDNMSRDCPPEMRGMREPGGRYDRALKTLTAAKEAKR